MKPLTLEETRLKEEMKERCLAKGQYIDENAKAKFEMLCHLEDFEVQYWELQQENKKLNGAIQTYDILLKANTEENKQLKDNWNKLKEKTNEGIRICRNKGYDLVFGIEEIPKEELDDFLSYLAFQVMEQLIINIEQGSDSNEI